MKTTDIPTLNTYTLPERYTAPRVNATWPLPAVRVSNYSRTRVADARDYEIMLRFMKATIRERNRQ